MTRPLLRPSRPAVPPAVLRRLLCGMAFAGLVACAPGGRDPAVSSIAVPPSRAAAVPAGRGQASTAQAPAQGMRDQAAVAAACRGDADRIIVTRDRGQLMREDEAASRVGSQASIYSQRAETDRLGRIFERDRIASDCVQENTRGAPR